MPKGMESDIKNMDIGKNTKLVLKKVWLKKKYEFYNINWNLYNSRMWVE